MGFVGPGVTLSLTFRRMLTTSETHVRRTRQRYLLRDQQLATVDVYDRKHGTDLNLSAARMVDLRKPVQRFSFACRSLSASARQRCTGVILSGCLIDHEKGPHSLGQT